MLSDKLDITRLCFLIIIGQEREADQRRIEELMEENLALCLAQRRTMEESQLLGWELEQLSKTTETSPGQSCCGQHPAHSLVPFLLIPQTFNGLSNSATAPLNVYE